MNISISTKKKKITVAIAAAAILAIIIFIMLLYRNDIKSTVCFDETVWTYVDANNWSIIAMDNNFLPVTVNVSNNLTENQGDAHIRVLDSGGTYIYEDILLKNNSQIEFYIAHDVGNYTIEAKAEFGERDYVFKITDY